MIRFTTPPEAVAPGLQCFKPILHALNFESKKLPGHHDSLVVILGAHALRPAVDLSPATAIFNFEQVHQGSPWFDPSRGYVERCRKHRLFDYSPANVEAWKYIYGIEAELLPIGYSEAMVNDTPPAKTFGVGDLPIFYGSINSRRHHHLSLMGIQSVGAWGDDLIALMKAAPAVVNIHFYESAIFEIVRCCQPLANCVPVLSEPSKDQSCYPVEDLFFSLEEIWERIQLRDFPSAQAQLESWKKCPTLSENLNSIKW